MRSAEDAATPPGESRALVLKPAVTAGCWSAAGVLFAVVISVATWAPQPYVSWLVEIPLRLWGLLCIAAGAVVWTRSVPRIGQLMVASGTLYYVGDLRASTVVPVFAVGFCLAYAWLAVVAQLVLVWPNDVAASRAIAVLVPVCYLAAVGTQTLRYIVDRPEPPWLYFTPHPNTVTAKASSALLLVLTALVITVTVRRWVSASQLRRRPSAPVWTGVILVAVLTGAAGIASLTSAPAVVEFGIAAVACVIGLVAIPLAALIRSVRLQITQGHLAGVLANLNEPLDSRVPPPQLQHALARAVGDPTLQLAYPLDDGSLVDIDGQPTTLHPRPGRVVTSVRRSGTLFGLIDYDEALNEQHQIARAAVAVAGMAIEHAYLYARLRAQVEELHLSRLRLAAAGFEERHRIQRNLHDGVQQQLFAVLVVLDLAHTALADTTPDAARTARTTVRRAHRQLHDAVQSLRELVQGIYPTVLVEHGLAAAVEGLADLSPTPVSFEVPKKRWPHPVEVAAYFLIAEALANSQKHAGATHVQVTVTPGGGLLQIAVRDDGRGGAMKRPGGGLIGLHDRVQAAGGTLTITSATGAGTSILATFPVEEP